MCTEVCEMYEHIIETECKIMFGDENDFWIKCLDQ